jgi:hypothetical protein
MVKRKKTDITVDDGNQQQQPAVISNKLPRLDVNKQQPNSNVFKNKEKVLILGTRGINYR